MALTYPKLLEEWELRVVHKAEPAQEVEQQLFGVGLLQLGQALVEVWHLPIWVQQGYRLLIDEQDQLVKALHIARDNAHPLHQQQCLDADPALQRWLNQPANSVLLANALALSAQESWTGPHCMRWQYLTSLYLQMSMDELQQQLHQQAAQSARHHHMPDLWHPAEALLWPWEARRVHRGELPVAAPTAEDLAKWRKQCSELLVEPSRFSNAMHLTTFARDALVACGMRRVMLLMIDRTRTQLRVHQIAGLPAQASSLMLTIDQSSVLQRLLDAPAQVRLTPTNNAQFSARLPASLRTLFRGEHLLMRSVPSNGRVIMLIVADQGGQPFSEISVQAFGKTAQCIEKALHSFTNRSR